MKAEREEITLRKKSAGGYAVVSGKAGSLHMLGEQPSQIKEKTGKFKRGESRKREKSI